MNIISIIVSIIVSAPLAAQTSPEQLIQRAHAHILIQDPYTASDEISEGLKQFPQHQGLMRMHIEVLAKIGDEKQMMAVWKQYAAVHPDALQQRELLEQMAWGVLGKAVDSTSPIMRVKGLIGAFFANDAKGVALLKQHLKDPNSIVRAVTVRLCSELRDASLCNGVLQILQTEKVWQVRLEAIKATGTMQLVAAKPLLLKIVGSEPCHPEEKAAAIVSLVSLMDGADRETISALAQSKRAGLRAVAAEIVSHYDLNRDLDLIEALVKDSSADVRAAAIQTLCLVRDDEKPLPDCVREAVKDRNPSVALSAAWALTVHQEPQWFDAWLQSDNKEVQRLASVYLAACGKHALQYAVDVFRKHNDPYVKANLALGLIGQRVFVKEACDALFVLLKNSKERLMWEEEGPFRALLPSTARFDDDAMEQDPEEMSQLVQLDLLNLLAMMRYDKAQEATLHFLERQTWGISGMASILLLTEGGEEAVDIVRGMLSHPSEKVSVQAALVLALWGRGEEALGVLVKSYQTLDRELKEKILEALGQVGVYSTVDFLVQRFNEPAQSLRVIAACSLLQCLYH